MNMSVECRVSSVEAGVARPARSGRTSPVTRYPSPSGIAHLTPALSPPGAEREKSPVVRQGSTLNFQPSTLNRFCAFTLIEMLVVISILGILAALTVPVLKNFARSDATLGASRQLLDGVARARQLAVSQRTTVYMIFMPTNFWWGTYGTLPNAWWNSLTAEQKTAVTNLCDKQLTGYTFIARGAMGDQPGRHEWHYLGEWQTLPDGTFIALRKFTLTPLPATNYFMITNYAIAGFATNAIPFPTATNTLVPLVFPFVAFNYQGQLTTDGHTVAADDEYIPIARGSVIYAADPETKAFQLNAPDVSEMPPGNSTNSAFNIVHIDRLTGRAVLEFQKVQ
jgi:prepilin-type N-terminal cleavage/methylation domain-containing protein